MRITDDIGSPSKLMGAEDAVDAAPSPVGILPEKYAEFADVFAKESADQLPRHRSYDCAINLVDNYGSPTNHRCYSLSATEDKALQEYLHENIAKGSVNQSTSPFGAPIMFVKKKDGGLRLCVDYRSLNQITKREPYPLPQISAILRSLSQARKYTKIDLRGAYNLVRVKEGDEWKTAFNCKYGHFEYRVMPFGLMNAPGTFQRMMNELFQDDIDRFVVVYLDDLLIYSKVSRILFSFSAYSI